MVNFRLLSNKFQPPLEILWLNSAAVRRIKNLNILLEKKNYGFASGGAWGGGGGQSRIKEAVTIFFFFLRRAEGES